MSTQTDNSKPTRVTASTLQKMKVASEKIAVLTSYDASFTTLIEQAGVEAIIVGDSLGMVVQGHDSTIPVSMTDMVYHCANVSRASEQALIIADMPFMSYASVKQGLNNAAKLMREGGAQMVKIEGGAQRVELVKALVAESVPVCGHLGLQPQSVFQLGGYKVQGREAEDAARIIDDAKALEAAGAQCLIIECVPASLGRDLTKAVTIPVIGIGAGAECDGQVLVHYDMLGITPGHRPSFSKNFLHNASDIPSALKTYVEEVKQGQFPSDEHLFS